MLPTAIIVLREVLEAALVVGIVMAASRGAPGRGRWVSLGIAGGVLGAAAVAGSAGAISRAVAGIGQELFDAAILFAAVVMLGWHNVWMSRHGRELAASAARLGGAVREGSRPLWALGAVVGLAVLREGSEVVLFLYGIALSGENAAWAMAAGGAIGLAAGAAAGTAIYWGLVSIPLRYLFTVTSWLVLLLAAGMASGRRLPDAGRAAAAARRQSVGHLVPAQRQQHPRQGSAHPGRLYRRAGRHPGRVLSRHPRGHRRDDAASRRRTGPPAPAGTGRPGRISQAFFWGMMRMPRIRMAVLAAAVAVWLPGPAARADFKVKLPDAEYQELELETVGNYGRSGNPLTDNE